MVMGEGEIPSPSIRLEVVMPLYVFRCRGGYRYLVKLPMAEAGQPQRCPCGKPAQRVFTSPIIVMRPPNYSASPTDPVYWQGIHDDPEYLPCHIAPSQDLALVEASELRELCDLAKEET
jgi:predicted nucleic acid-binding Zn ribbon protein